MGKIKLATIALAGVLCAYSAAAQSLHGCADLENARIPSFEGPDGTFFQIDPDLLTYNRMPDGLVRDMAQLSQALSENGTQLILLPLPTKALAMPSSIGPDAIKFGYDYGLAAAIYDDAIDRLTQEEVAALNVRKKLVALTDQRSHFRADPRMTQDGVRAVASAVSDFVGTGEGDQLQSVPKSELTLPSLERQYLQAKCQTPLPLPLVQDYVLEQSGADNSNGSDHIVVAGSYVALDPALNFAGFLQERLGKEVRLWPSVDGTSAMSAYLTSDDFHTDRPNQLIWAFPIWQNPAQKGDRPMREMIAAAKGVCTTLETEEVGGTSARATLSGALDQGFLVLAEYPQPEVKSTFRFTSSKGSTRTRRVIRDTEPGSGNRFFMPLTGLWEDGAASIEVSGSNGIPPKLYRCQG